MPSTFSQIYIQVVFAVRKRECLINPEWEEELYRYINRIIQKKGQKPLAINGMPDHIHILIGLTPDCRLSDLVREIKKSSNNFINSHKIPSGGFKWQEGYGAFSYNQSHLDAVIQYIFNQKKHHLNKTFKKEYTDLLIRFQIPHKSEFLFDWFDE
jgi:REP element-mobilizing transposase RayT